MIRRLIPYEINSETCQLIKYIISFEHNEFVDNLIFKWVDNCIIHHRNRYRF